MKKCPTCQREFPDSQRFCQTDGTPLIESAPVQENDPFKTIVGGGGGNDDPFKTVVGGSGAGGNAPKDDFFNLPKPPSDPMKTMIVSPEEFKKEIESASPIKPPESPKPFEQSPPPFGDLSPKSPEKPNDMFGDFSAKEKAPPPFAPPSDSPFGKSPFDEPKASSAPSPFEPPKPPPFKEPESPFGNQPAPSPFDNSPFSPPQSPFGNQPFNEPVASGQSDWTPPAAPVQQWQDQGVGANTPFQPPAVSGGQNQTLAIVSLVCGILGFCCGILGIVGVITGFMAKNNADKNPAEYGGRGLALAGIILGAIGFLLNVILGVLSAVMR